MYTHVIELGVLFPSFLSSCVRLEYFEMGNIRVGLGQRVTRHDTKRQIAGTALGVVLDRAKRRGPQRQ